MPAPSKHRRRQGMDLRQEPAKASGSGARQGILRRGVAKDTALARGSGLKSATQSLRPGDRGNLPSKPAWMDYSGFSRDQDPRASRGLDPFSASMSLALARSRTWLLRGACQNPAPAKGQVLRRHPGRSTASGNFARNRPLERISARLSRAFALYTPRESNHLNRRFLSCSGN